MNGVCQSKARGPPHVIAVWKYMILVEQLYFGKIRPVGLNIVFLWPSRLAKKKARQDTAKSRNSVSGAGPPQIYQKLCTQTVLVDLGGPAPDTEFRDLTIPRTDVTSGPFLLKENYQTTK